MDKRGKIIFYGIISGSILGIAAGLIFGQAMTSIAWMGTFFLNSLKMIIIPLLVFSMVNGITGLGKTRSVGSLGLTTIVYYLSTTFIAVFIGLVLVNIIQPGVSQTIATLPDSVPGAAAATKTFSDLILGFVSPNIVEAMVHMDLLPVIVFSILFGFALSSLGERAEPVVRIIGILNDAIIELVQIILWISPVGVFSLIAAKIGSFGSEHLWAELSRLGMYAFTVVTGLAIHGFVILPVILLVLSKRNPLKYFKNSLTALLTAFSTASSSATLPVTIECAEKNNGVSPQSAGFVLPLGATINMDGTALYEAVAAMYIAQVYGIHLSFFDQTVIFLTASLAAIGAAGIPEAGLVTMALVLGAVKLPLEGITMLLTIDWLLDRFRTTINVWGDTVGAGVIDKIFFARKSENLSREQ